MSWEKESGLQKISRYCAYQERARSEVRQKLRKLECPEEEIDGVIDEMEADGFLNEERFARAYVRGKFRQLGWGKIKLKIELRKKWVPEALIDLALEEEIGYDPYRATLQKQLEKRISGLADLRNPMAKQKLIRSMQSRGYEFEVIMEVMGELDA